MNSLDANNLRSCIKMISLIQNLILDYKSLKADSDNPEIVELNNLLKQRKLLDIQIEMNNFKRFVSNTNAKLEELSF